MTATLTKSKIERSWPATFGYIGAGIISLVLAVAIFMYTSVGLWLGSLAVAFIILGLIFLGMALSGAGACACPGCGKPLSGLSTGKNEGILCPACQQYFEGSAGELWATDPSTVSSNPIFSTVLPETFNFPEGCCVCGKPETHRVKISTTTQGGGDAALAATTGIRHSTRISVEVPHCDEHKDGALLGGTKQKTIIRFRSYPYMRAFCELNKTTPA